MIVVVKLMIDTVFLLGLTRWVCVCKSKK